MPVECVDTWSRGPGADRYRSTESRSPSSVEGKIECTFIFLSQNLGREIMHLEWFEPLKNSSYRSMRFAHVKLLNNLRIIYCIAHEKAYLLVAFKEHNSGDYTRALGIAKNRADQIG